MTAIRGTEFRHVSEMVRDGFREVDAQNYLRPKLAEMGFDEAAVNAYFAEQRQLIDYEQNRAGVREFFRHGLQGSVLGMTSRQKLPDAVTQQEIQQARVLDRVAMGAGGLLADFPLFIPGLVAGSAIVDAAREGAMWDIAERNVLLRQLQPTMTDKEREAWAATREGREELARHARYAGGGDLELTDLDLARAADVAHGAAKGAVFGSIIKFSGLGAQRAARAALTGKQARALEQATHELHGVARAERHALGRGASANTQAWHRDIRLAHEAWQEEAARAYSARLSEISPVLGGVGTAMEMISMPGAAALLEGRAPTGQEYIDNGLLILGMRGMHLLPHLTRRMRQLYAKANITPSELRQRIEENPNLLAELMAGQHADLSKRYGQALPMQIMEFLSARKRREALKGLGVEDLDLPGGARGERVTRDILDIALSPDYALDEWIPGNAFTPEQYVALRDMGLAKDGYVSSRLLRALINAKHEQMTRKPEAPVEAPRERQRTDYDVVPEVAEQAPRPAATETEVDGVHQDKDGYWRDAQGEQVLPPLPPLPEEAERATGVRPEPEDARPETETRPEREAAPVTEERPAERTEAEPEGLIRNPEEQARVEAAEGGAPEDITDTLNKTMDRMELAKDIINELKAAGFGEEYAQALGIISAAHAEHWGPVFGMDPYDYMYNRRARYIGMTQAEFERLGRTGLDGMYELRQRKAMLEELDVDERASLSAQRRTLDPEFDYIYGRVDADSVADMFDADFVKELRRELGPSFFAARGKGERIENLAEDFLRENAGEDFMDINIDSRMVSDFIERTMRGNKEFFDRLYTGKLYQMLGEQGARALDAAEGASRRLDGLAIAREMEGAGRDAKAVKLATGWERGADGLWRYEIDDSKTTVDLGWLQDGPTTLDWILEAPELFKAYPQLKKVRVVAESSLSEDTVAAYSKAGNTILLNPRFNSDALRSSLRHEIQHAIQDIEGFARGGTVEQFTDHAKLARSNKAFDRLQDIEREHREAVRDFVAEQAKRYIAEWTDIETGKDGRFSEPYNIGGRNVTNIHSLAYAVTDRMIDRHSTPDKALADIIREADGAMHEFFESKGIYDKAPKALADIAERHRKQKAELDALAQDPLTAYKRSAGEVEARNVQTRRDLTYEERLRSLASETEDVAREDQIVLREGLEGGAQSISSHWKRHPAFQPALTALSEIASGKGYGVVHHPILGEIQYPLGRFGKIRPNGKTKGGEGFLHIVQDRMWKDGASLDEAIDIAFKVGMAAAAGKERLRRYNTKHLVLGGVEVVVAKDQNGNHVITGYKLDWDEVAGRTAGAHRRPAASIASAPHVSSGQVVAALNGRITQLQSEVKQGSVTLYQTAYHGTPHRFDKFTLDHIGEGEGAQVHGWGLYFAAGRDVAEGYRQRLTGNKLQLGGQEYTGPEGTRPEAVSLAANYLKEAASLKTRSGRIKRAMRLIVDGANPNDRYDYNLRQEALEVIKDLQSRKGEYTIGEGGQVYGVDIPENHLLLDEQKPFSQQPEAVQSALRQAAKDIGLDISDRHFTIEASPSGKTFTVTHPWALRGSNAPRFRSRAAAEAWAREHARDPKYQLGPKTGKDLYLQLSRKLGNSPEAASKWLNEHGVKGITYDGRQDGRCFVVFDDAAIQTLETYYQSGKSGGGRTARGGYRRLDDRAIVGLFEKANASTAIHETGHHWLEELRYAVELNRSEMANEMWRKLQNAYGFDSLSDPVVWKNVHERFARDFEAYLREGRAPSWELQNVFARCREWLREIYRTVKGLLGEEQLSEDVRWVFDRMLASEEEIARSPRKTRAPEQEGPRRKVAEEPTTEEREVPVSTPAEGSENVSRRVSDGTKATDEALPAQERRSEAEAPDFIPSAEPEGGQTDILARRILPAAVPGNAPPAPAPGPQVMPGADFKPGDAISLQNIAAAFSEALNTPIRLGRMGRMGRKALGFFRIKENVIRVRKLQDVRTVAHESGHALQKALFGRVDPADFQPWAHELRPLATVGNPVLEGFAEFVAKYVSDPNVARNAAPTFYAAFESMMNQKAPHVLGVLLQARQTLDAWKRQPALAQVAGHVSWGNEGQESLLTRMFRKETWEDLYINVVNGLYGLRWAEKQIVGKEKLSPDESPYMQARLFNGVAGKITHFLERGTFSHKTHQNAGEPLKKIYDDVDNKTLFSAFLVARRGVELAKRGIETGIDPAIMQAAYDSAKAKYEPLAQRLDTYQSSLLLYLAESGVLDPKAVAAMEVLNKNYVPFQRLMDDPQRSGVQGGGDSLRATDPVRRIRGSSRMIINPLESIVSNTVTLIEAAEKNKIARTLVELAGKYENTGWLVEKLDPKMIKTDLNAEAKRRILEAAAQADPVTAAAIDQFIKNGSLDGVFNFWQTSKAIDQGKEISVFVNGSHQVYQVDPRIAQVINGLTPEVLPLWVRVLNFISTKPLRWGSTTTPSFMARNIFRDNVSSGVLSRSGFIPFWHLWSGLWSALRRDEDYWAWMKAGGSNTHELMRGRKSAQKLLADLQSTGYMERVWNTIRAPKELFGLLPLFAYGSELSEYSTRLGEFKLARRKARAAGMDEKNAAQQAAYEARDLQDFAVHGSNMRSALALTAFMGSQIQGLDRGIRGFRENPKGFLARAAVLSVVSIAFALLTHDDKRVMELDDGQRDMFWCFATGEGNDYTIWRLPKPFEVGVLFGSTFERLTHMVLDTKKEKEGWEETRWEQIQSLLGSLWDVSTPNIMPTSLVPIAENTANRKKAFGTPIVPKRVEDLLPEYRAGEWTSPTMKAASRITGGVVGRANTFSPAKAENLVAGYAGGQGRNLLRLLDYTGEKIGWVEPPPEIAKGLESWPVINAYTYAHPGSRARSIRRFYDMAGTVDQGLKTLGYLRRTTSGEKDEEIAALEREFQPYADVAKTKRALNTILTAMRLVKTERVLNDQQRYSLRVAVRDNKAESVQQNEWERMLKLTENPDLTPRPLELTPVERRDLLEILFEAALQVSRQGIIQCREAKRAIKELEQLGPGAGASKPESAAPAPASTPAPQGGQDVVNAVMGLLGS